MGISTSQSVVRRLVPYRVSLYKENARKMRKSNGCSMKQRRFAPFSQTFGGEKNSDDSGLADTHLRNKLMEYSFKLVSAWLAFAPFPDFKNLHLV